jgi:hypothetical protein
MDVTGRDVTLLIQMQISKEEKLTQLEKILHGRSLQGSENLKAFLRFVVDRAIEGHENQLKEYVIATEVFGRGKGCAGAGWKAQDEAPGVLRDRGERR